MALKRSDHPFCPSRDLVATLTHGTVSSSGGTWVELLLHSILGLKSYNILNQTVISIKDVILSSAELF